MYTFPSATINFMTFTALRWGQFPTIAYTTGAVAGFEVVTLTDDPMSSPTISVQIQSGVSTNAQIKAAISSARGTSVDGLYPFDMVSMAIDFGHETDTNIAVAPTALSGASSTPPPVPAQPSQPTGVTPGSYTDSDITVDEFGRITAATSGAGGSGANTALSNLAAVAINQSLIPGLDDDADIGSSLKRWVNLFLSANVQMSSTGTVNFVGNTLTAILSFDEGLGSFIVDTTNGSGGYISSPVGQDMNIMADGGNSLANYRIQGDQHRFQQAGNVPAMFDSTGLVMTSGIITLPNGVTLTGASGPALQLADSSYIDVSTFLQFRINSLFSANFSATTIELDPGNGNMELIIQNNSGTSNFRVQGTTSDVGFILSDPTDTFTNPNSFAIQFGTDNSFAMVADKSATPGDVRLKAWNVDHATLESVVTSSQLPPMTLVTSHFSETNAAATNTFADFTSISLTAGTWLVSAFGNAYVTDDQVTEIRMGISTTTGNNGTGLVFGDNESDMSPPSGLPGLTDMSFTSAIPNWILTVGSTMTVYFKSRMNYAGNIPTIEGRLTALKVSN